MEERPLVRFSLNFKGVFHLKQLYMMIREWLMENGYKEDKWMEQLYLQREGPPGKEHWIWWRMNKNINKYFKYKFNVDFHTLTISDTEIVHEGKKVKAQKGEIEVFFDMRLILDPNDQWENHWLLKHEIIQRWWKGKFFKPEIDQHEELSIKDAYRLQGVLKQYLDLKGFMHEYQGELYHPVRGLE